MNSQHWFLLIAFGVVAYVLWGGDDRAPAEAQRAPQALNYNVIGVSPGLTPEAEALNLADDLDVALLPEIGKQAIRDAAGQGLREQAFLEHVLRDVSERVREISTIDLNADGITDPVLVRPEPGEDASYALLSLQVPAPDAYPLPAAGDMAAWKNVETVEVATMSVSLNAQQLTVDAAGNEHVYPGQGSRHYTAYDRSPSFLETYFAIRMLDWMFFPSYYGWWGPGWGYGGYRPVPVPVATERRSDTVRQRGYARTGAGAPAVKTASGSAPRSRYQKATAGQPPKALRDLQATRRFQRRDASAGVGKGGFGRTGERTVRTTRAPTVRRGYGRAPRVRGYSFGRSAGRGFGGFGRMRGFRFR